MMRYNLRMILGVIGLLAITVTASQAADLKRALSEAEGRKKAAENGLMEIKSKGQPSDELRRAYVDAATQQNAWLDAVCGAVEQGTATAPDVSTSAQTAATALVQWVNQRNRVLGLPELRGAIADSVQKKTAQDLIDIASDSWKSNRSGDGTKRAAAAASLKGRLRWKSFDEVR
jgi:hypothetical protein